MKFENNDRIYGQTQEERALEIQIKNTDEEIGKLKKRLAEAQKGRAELEVTRCEYAKLRCGYGR